MEVERMIPQEIAAQALIGEFVWVDQCENFSKLSYWDSLNHDVGQRIFDALEAAGYIVTPVQDTSERPERHEGVPVDMTDKPLWDRMREAADTLDEVQRTDSKVLIDPTASRTLRRLADEWEVEVLTFDLAAILAHYKVKHPANAAKALLDNFDIKRKP